MGTTFESGTALFIPYYIRSSCESEVPVPMTQKAVLAIVEFFHAPNGAGAVEIWELPDIEPFALCYFHSFYSHSHLMFERLS